MSRIHSFFAAHPELRAVIGAVLEGRAGRIHRNGEGPPRAARLSLGCYEVLGGDPTTEEARQLILSSPRPCELVYGNDPGWRRRILEVLGSAVQDRPMRSFDACEIRPEPLRAMVLGLPSGFALRPIGRGLSAQLDHDLEPHALQAYATAEAFLKDGFGFGVVKEGRLACAATSYASCAGQVELAIATRPACRGLGLAAAASAGFILEALKRGLVPHWNASNPVSQRLAARLGYGPGGTCEVLYRA
jgi:GNAT superfamily N-acetyltransferase